MKLRTILLPLLLVACAAQGGAGDASGGSGATSSSNAGSSASAGASLGDSSSGSSSLAGATSAGATSAGASAAGDAAGGQAGFAAAGDSAGGSAGAAGGTSSGGTGGNSGNSSGGSGDSMLQDGIQPYFLAADTTTATAISAILGELHVVNTDGGNATLNLLKVRYYFTNEGTMPLMQMNWAHLSSPTNQVDVPFMAAVVKMQTPEPTADSYIEFTCDSTNVLDAGKQAVVSFRLYDGSNQPVFLQNNDYSFSATATPSNKIVLLYRDVVIWGVEP